LQRERFRSVFARFNIRPVQLTALSVVYFNPRLSQAELGQTLDMKQANVVKLIDELQARELLERKLSSNDRRRYEIVLTRRGKQFTAKLLDIHGKLEADLARSFGQDELQQLISLLRRFRQVEAEPKIR